MRHKKKINKETTVEMSTTIKQLSLAVRPDQNWEQLCDQLKDQDFVNEFEISVQNNKNIKEIFHHVSSFLQTQKELSKITIEIETKQFFNFEETLYQLRGLTQVTDLTLVLRNQGFFLSQQRIPLGECFSQYCNLLSLEFHIDCNYLKGKEHLFSMGNLYRANPNLTKLDVSLSSIPEKSGITYSVLEGIRFLKKLEKLDLCIYQTKGQSYQILDCLEEVLEENDHIKDFKLYFSYSSIIEYEGFLVLSRVLKKLHGLENFEIEIYDSKKDQNSIEEFGFEDSLFALPKLKSINLNLNSNSDKKVLRLIKAIPQCNQLEDIKLDLAFRSQTSFQDKDKLIQFRQSLEMLTNLSSLILQFNYFSKLSYSDIVQLIGSLHKLTNLKKLSIYVSRFVQNEELQQSDIDLFKQVVSKLKIISFEAHSNRENSFSELDNIESVIHQASDLEDINLEINKYQFYKDDTVDERPLMNIFENKTKIKRINLQVPKEKRVDIPHQQQMIKSISQNPQLHQLEMSFKNKNNYSSLVQSLGESLSYLPELKELDLSFGKYCEIHDAEFNVFVEQLKSKNNFQKFFWKFNREELREETLNNFASSFSRMKELQVLSITNTNSVKKSKFEYTQFLNALVIPNKIYSLQLNFKAAHLEFSNITNLFEQISQLAELKYLRFQFQSFNVSYKESIQLKQYLSKLQLLSYIKMSHYSMNLLYLLTLFQDIESLSNIEFNNDYSDYLSVKVEAKRSIFQDKKQVSTLLNQDRADQTVSLQIQTKNLFAENQEDEKDLRFIFESLSPLTNFKLYIHSNNNIGSNYSSELFKNFSKLQNLKELSLKIMRANQIGGESLILLGESLVRLPKLKKLSLAIQLQENDIDNESQSWLSKLGQLVELVSFKIELQCQKNTNQDQLQLNYTLFKNVCAVLRNLVNLNALKITITNLKMDQDSIEELIQTFKYYEHSLQHFKIQLNIKTDQIHRRLMKGLSILTHLNTIQLRETDFKFNSILKLHKLVSYSKKEKEFEYYQL